MRKIITVDGNEACSYYAYMFTEVAGIYPITPASPMAEHIDEWSSNKRLNIFNDNVKVIEMQSEAGAAGMVHGSLQAGLLTTTFTASQGLLLMIPNMYKIAGEMLPGVIHVAARSLASHALSIFGDHQDVYATRMTGFCMMASSSVQDAANLSLITHLSAIKASLPFLHFFDGFRTSHEIDKIEVLEMSDIIDFVDYQSIDNFRNRALNLNNKVTRGTAQNDDIYFQALEVRNKFYDTIPNIVNDYMQMLNKKMGTNYEPFMYYGNSDADNIIVAMGSVCSTIKEVIDELNKEDRKVGLIEVHLYRPFSVKYLLDVLPNSVKKIAVLDRTKEPGSVGEPLYLDIANALNGKKIEIVGGRYGLASKNTTPAQIKAVYDMLASNLKNNFTIGINDDITDLSLVIDDNFKITNHDEFLIYGYGSDGMVSASKSIIKLIGDNTNKYVQGYFQYDSKKSGGVTISHLRFSNDIIRSTYYVENPKLVAVTKDSYLLDFNPLFHILENGIFILNTIMTEDEVKNWLPNNIKKIIISKNIKFYIINAYEFARKIGLKNKISTIMESIIMKLSNIMNYDQAKEKMKEYVKQKFYKKGEDIVKANYDAIENCINYLKEIKIEPDVIDSVPIEKSKDVYEVMTKREGDLLPTSAFFNYPDGTFIGGTSCLEKRGISLVAPKWINANCIECNQCSFVCPHSVIRPFLLNEDEYNAAPDFVKSRVIKAIGTDYYYCIGISIKDCTGCGLCIKTCPGKNKEKALITKRLDEQLNDSEQEVFDYLVQNITYKPAFKLETVKGSQFKMPKFEFCGACAGCGEPSYIKILTQLFGESMIIANATGCSSIYGGSAPITPYKIPWSNSLFEDNAEYGYGLLLANNTIRSRIKKIMENHFDNENKDLFKKWIDNCDDYLITKEVYDQLDYGKCPKELVSLKEYITYRSIWTIGGDGWAYDIGFGGIDHVLASGDNVNILVLDTQIYSNTGGQSSKASPKGSIASFTTSGKLQNKKDLARIALSYPHVYVAQVSLGANMMQVLKAFKEAENYKGPSIIIAYAPCISHGIKGGMENSLEMQKMAVKCGYFLTFRYNPETEHLTLDSKDVDFNLYEDFLMFQTRYSALEKINKENAKVLLDGNKSDAIKRFEFYKKQDGEVV